MHSDDTQTVKCNRCGANLLIPMALDTAIKDEIIHLFRHEDKLLAMRLLKQRTTLSLAHCKAFIMHLQATSEACHQCGKEIEREELSTCPHCSSLNINW